MKKLSEIFGLDKLSTIQLRNQSDYEQGMADGFEEAIRVVDQFEIDYEYLQEYILDWCDEYYEPIRIDMLKAQVPPEKLFKKKVG